MGSWFWSPWSSWSPCKERLSKKTKGLKKTIIYCQDQVVLLDRR
jgi:hypothetical protein